MVKKQKDVGMGFLVYSPFITCLACTLPSLSSFCGFGTAIPTSLYIFGKCFSYVFVYFLYTKKGYWSCKLLSESTNIVITAAIATSQWWRYIYGGRVGLEPCHQSLLKLGG